MGALSCTTQVLVDFEEAALAGAMAIIKGKFTRASS